MIVAWSYLVENHLVKALYPQSPYRNDISQPLPVTCSESSDTSSGITGNREMERTGSLKETFLGRLSETLKFEDLAKCECKGHRGAVAKVRTLGS